MVTPGMELATRHPEWLSRTRDGRLTSISAAGEVAWLNPFRPEVQKLIQELVVEIVATSGADGIQFDDHMSLPSEFGYDPFTVALYKRETGRTAPADAQEPAWLQWRANKLTAFMAQLHKVVNEQHPGALVSLSPNYHDFAYKRQLQQWREWVRPKPPAPAAWGWRSSISKPSGSAVMSPPSYARRRWGVCFRSRLHAPCRPQFPPAVCSNVPAPPAAREQRAVRSLTTGYQQADTALSAAKQPSPGGSVTLTQGRTRKVTLRAPVGWAHVGFCSLGPNPPTLSPLKGLQDGVIAAPRPPWPPPTATAWPC